MKIGILGAGHLGKFHIQQALEIPELEVVGFYDPNREASEKLASDKGLRLFNSVDELVDASDIVDVVTPTLSHYECALKAIRKSKHVFIEKPITHTVEEAAELLKLAREAQVKIQVGHIERFNPAFVLAREHISDPRFIEIHRLAQFNPRGTDVSVILDLMIHDIDIVLGVVPANIRRISASGVAVISDTPDIANARLEFDNGCVANITASRISLKNMRKARFFQKDAYISVDFLEKKPEIVTMKDAGEETSPLSIRIDLGEGKPDKEVSLDIPEVPQTNAIREELKSFYTAIRDNKTPVVPIEDGYMALKVAHEVLDKMRLTSELIYQKQ